MAVAVREVVQAGAGQWRAVPTGAQRGLEALISGSSPNLWDVSELPADPSMEE